MKCRVESKFTGCYLYLCGEDDSDVECQYDITGRISLAKAYEEIGCTYEVIYSLISTISKEGRRIEEEGNDTSGMILDPSYIYIEAQQIKSSLAGRYNALNNNNKIQIFYYPGNTGREIEKELLHLAEFIIEHADYKDRDAVDIAYNFYLSVYRRNYVFDDLLK